ncbi:hypothetical protein FRC08_005115 [Ceratobasidium sp. 394]|nr:hypothetical protein FRC08_005115 [Ceratobasidium sp. 394]
MQAPNALASRSRLDMLSYSTIYPTSWTSMRAANATGNLPAARFAIQRFTFTTEHRTPFAAMVGFRLLHAYTLRWTHTLPRFNHTLHCKTQRKELSRNKTAS